MTVWRGALLIGAIPLYLQIGIGGPLGIRRLGFISTGEVPSEETCPDYLNILFRPGEEHECVEAGWKAIGLMEWDHLLLLDLPEDTPLLRTQSLPSNIRRFPRGRCPIADLTGGFDAYVGSLSGKTRSHARQYLRAAERDGAVFELAAAADTDQFFDDLVRLHQERWTTEGKAGCFAAARFTEFHRCLAREWVPSGRAVLARLSHGGQVYAVMYGFVIGSKFDFYQSGIRRTETGPFESPGTIANLLLMKTLAQRGITAYDFLRGSSSYKERLGTCSKQLIAAEIWRPTPRALCYRSLHLGWRILRKAFRVVRRATS